MTLAPRKRSLTLAGHRTSVTLETPFWEALRAMAKARGRSVAGTVAEIDAARPAGVGLATAVRLAVLDDLQRALAARREDDTLAPS